MNFKLLLEGKDLEFKSWLWWRVVVEFLTQKQTERIVGKDNRDIICSLEFYETLNHKFSYFLFQIFTLHIKDVSYVSFE